MYRTIQFNGSHDCNQYSVLFSEGFFDFSTIDYHYPKQIKISTAFGSSIVLVNPAVPTKITINSSFSTVQLPRQLKSSIGGQFVYKTATAHEYPLLEIKASVTFGNLIIEELK